jgi:8-oxo-dGTP diphosphatase
MIGTQGLSLSANATEAMQEELTDRTHLTQEEH